MIPRAEYSCSRNSEIRSWSSNGCSPRSKVRDQRFVGQSDGADGMPGMAPKQQLARLEEFRNGTHNVLICTSVGEEGLDVPSATTVILYEPVASAIRMIQRRGRTARRRDGAVKVLIAAGTRDEHVRRASQRREARMVRILNEVRIQLRLPTVINRDLRDHDRFRVRHGRSRRPSKRSSKWSEGASFPQFVSLNSHLRRVHHNSDHPRCGRPSRWGWRHGW